MLTARKIQVGVVALVLAAILATYAYLRYTSTRGPIRESFGSSICMPTKNSGVDFSFAEVRLINRSSRDVTITKVDLYRPVGMRMTEAYVMPFSGGTVPVYGVGSVWPPVPAIPQPEGFGWNARKPAVGHVVRPGEEHLVLVLHLVRDSATTNGGFHSVRIEYKSGLRTYHAKRGPALGFAPNAKCSPDE